MLKMFKDLKRERGEITKNKNFLRENIKQQNCKRKEEKTTKQNKTGNKIMWPEINAKADHWQTSTGRKLFFFVRKEKKKYTFFFCYLLCHEEEEKAEKQ
jgi:hypothetical protein